MTLQSRASRLACLYLVALTFFLPHAFGLPKGTNLTSLVGISESNLGSSALRVLTVTLQGVVARQSSQQIYVDGGRGYSLWYNHLNTAYGIPRVSTANPWLLVSQFRNLVSGYILYDAAANSNSLNVATSLCGPFNAIGVDITIESIARSYGITNRLADVRTYN